LSKHKNTQKLNPQKNGSLVRTTHISVHMTAQLCYTIQYRTVLMIFPLVVQTIIIAQMSNGGEGVFCKWTQ